MKKSILFATLILISGMMNGQNLQKGNLIGTHVMTVTLNPGITMEKYLDFCNAKLIPEMEKAMPGWKCYLVKGIRGENPSSYGMIYVIKSQADRDKYYNADGTDTELGKKVNEKLKPFTDELTKMGTFTTKYTDWVVL